MADRMHVPPGLNRHTDNQANGNRYGLAHLNAQTNVHSHNHCGFTTV